MSEYFYLRNGYAHISGFLNPVIVSAMNQYVLSLRNTGNLHPDVEQVKGSLTTSNDMVMDTLLSKMRPIIEKIVDRQLLPTYAFVRHYRKGDKLKKHTDRESCEYTMSMTLGYEANSVWPIMLDMDGEIKIKLDIGQGLIYKGRDVVHWRKKFKGVYQNQVFLHYVDANGEFADCVFDGRPGLQSLDYDVEEPYYVL